MATTRSVRIANGMLMKKSQRQLKFWVMNPPAAGPMIEASPNDAPIIPWYLPRSRGEMMSPMIAWDSGMMKPMPAPWTKRENTRNQQFGATPDNAAPTAKTTMPVMYRG